MARARSCCFFNLVKISAVKYRSIIYIFQFIIDKSFHINFKHQIMVPREPYERVEPPFQFTMRIDNLRSLNHATLIRYFHMAVIYVGARLLSARAEEHVDVIYSATNLLHKKVFGREINHFRRRGSVQYLVGRYFETVNQASLILYSERNFERKYDVLQALGRACRMVSRHSWIRLLQRTETETIPTFLTEDL